LPQKNAEPRDSAVLRWSERRRQGTIQQPLRPACRRSRPGTDPGRDRTMTNSRSWKI